MDNNRITPRYIGFNGHTSYDETDNSVTFTGLYEFRGNNVIVITELPPTKWSQRHAQCGRLR